jgi:hypothetical protein
MATGALMSQCSLGQTSSIRQLQKLAPKHVGSFLTSLILGIFAKVKEVPFRKISDEIDGKCWDLPAACVYVNGQLYLAWRLLLVNDVGGG